MEYNYFWNLPERNGYDPIEPFIIGDMFLLGHAI